MRSSRCPYMHIRAVWAFTVRTRDGFPDFDGGNLLVFVDHVFEFRAEPALRHGGFRAGSGEAAHGPFEVIFHVRVPTTIV